LARLGALAQFGPNLGRPNVDTLEGSDFANMKELRFRLDGLWRFAFAFDPKQASDHPLRRQQARKKRFLSDADPNRR
jgi:hypothetical protein